MYSYTVLLCQVVDSIPITEFSKQMNVIKLMLRKEIGGIIKRFREGIFTPSYELTVVLGENSFTWAKQEAEYCRRDIYTKLRTHKPAAKSCFG